MLYAPLIWLNNHNSKEFVVGRLIENGVRNASKDCSVTVREVLVESGWNVLDAHTRGWASTQSPVNWNSSARYNRSTSHQYQRCFLRKPVTRIEQIVDTWSWTEKITRIVFYFFDLLFFDRPSLFFCTLQTNYLNFFSVYFFFIFSQRILLDFFFNLCQMDCIRKQG